MPREFLKEPMKGMLQAGELNYLEICLKFVDNIPK